MRTKIPVTILLVFTRLSLCLYKIPALGFSSPHPRDKAQGHEYKRCEKNPMHRFRRIHPSLWSPGLNVLLLSLCVLVGSCSESEVYKPLIEISNAKLTRPAEDVLRVTLDYELAPAERLPLPYKEIVVSPLEPQVKIFATLEEFILSVDTIIIKLGIPEGAVDWQDLSDPEECCAVSLKGLVEEGGKSRYERISNHLRVLPPEPPQ